MAPPLLRERVEELEQRVLELEKAMAILLAAPNWSELPPAPAGQE